MKGEPAGSGDAELPLTLARQVVDGRGATRPGVGGGARASAELLDRATLAPATSFPRPAWLSAASFWEPQAEQPGLRLVEKAPLSER